MRSLLVCVSLVLFSATAVSQQQNPNPLGDGRLNYPQGFPTSHVTVTDPPSLKYLSSRENKLWQARANGKPDPIRKLVSDDATIASFTGATNRHELIAQVETGACRITSYRLGDFALKHVSPTEVTITYRAEQNAVCNGKALPQILIVTVTYLDHYGKWLSTLYDEKSTTPVQPEINTR